MGAFARYLRDYRTWAFLLVVAGLTASCVAIRYALTETVTEAEQMATYTTSWTDSNGDSQTVVTTRAEGEDAAAHAARHQAAVDALKAIYPPAE